MVFAPAEPQFARYGTHATAPMFANPAFGIPVVGGLPKQMRTQNAKDGFYGRHGATYYQAKWVARVRSLQSVDRAVESLYTTLEETGEADNTYVVFTSDNGYALGEHRLYRKNVLTEEALRVPLLVTGPGITPGTTSTLPVTLVDLVATLTDLTRITPHRTLDGASFAPTLHGTAQTWRDTTLIQTGSERTTGPQPGWAMRGVRTARYSYAKDVNTGERVLFDHHRDPHETRNLITNRRYRNIIRHLNTRTNKLVTCTGTYCNRRFGTPPAPARPRRR